MMPYEPILDIMRRTMANLEFVERHASDDGPFEVTQLLNSFLGALAHPWENLKRELNSISIVDAEREGWPILPRERATDQLPRSLGDLIGHLRHGVAHGNVSFLPGGHGEIAALRIENRYKGVRTWGAIVTPEAMRLFLKRFVALVEELEREAGGPKRIA
jgi:hypothetical protein